jgi:hypothetical protein
LLDRESTLANISVRQMAFHHGLLGLGALSWTTSSSSDTRPVTVEEFLFQVPVLRALRIGPLRFTPVVDGRRRRLRVRGRDRARSVAVWSGGFANQSGVPNDHDLEPLDSLAC